MGTNDRAGNTPAYSINVGHIHLSIWENQSDNGRTWFNTQIARRYKDGETWKDSTSFSGLGDLALLAEAVRLAQKFVTGREHLLAAEGRDAF
ncbi:MAG: hypothetical protein KF708_07975 [Pirellulales bacterium]|nr:hypothetical protein [Pirellulales bacterium]